MASNRFDEAHVLHELRHFLPSQTPLKDFIHHNSLHAFQQMKFYDAIFKASALFGYQVTLELQDFRKLYQTGRIRKDILEDAIIRGKGVEEVNRWSEKMLHGMYDESVTPRIGQLRTQWKNAYHLDIDSLVHPYLFRILCSYLDQGIALWDFPVREEGFLASLLALEKTSYSSFFKTKRTKELFLSGKYEMSDLLFRLVGDEALYEQYIFDQQFSHRGWSGMAATIEDRPDSLLDPKKISLKELILFELLLEIDTLDHTLGTDWKPLCHHVKNNPVNLFDEVAATEIQEVFRLWQDAFEWSYYDEVLTGISKAKAVQKEVLHSTSFQAVFCIDERECSLRRHLEHSDPACETLGSPGFFGVEFYFQPEGGKFYDKLCPAPVTPKYLIKEVCPNLTRGHELLYTPRTHTLLPGFLSAMTLGFAAGVRLVQNIVKPTMSPAISNAFSLMVATSSLRIENLNIHDRENDLQVGFTIEEMAVRVEGLLRSIGLITRFAPLVYIVAHGSSSANNPHHGAHDCGACSGRPGSVNARVFAFMANHQKVRNLLEERGLHIPAETQFVGALHDTAGDEIEYYDEATISILNQAGHHLHKSTFEQALNLNAKERSRRFASIQTNNPIETVRKAIKDRSVSLFEPRPELGHGTNTLCIVGRRELTKNLFLDRRAFLNSYDYTTDPEGKLLVGVMKPLGPVCGGINLEYYFSRVDNHKLGAGTKLPHHVMGLIGVANSFDGDLRPGLPLQMIEVHDPVRLLIVVEHFPDVVLRTIQSAPDMYEWFINEWVHLVVMHPEKNTFHYFKEGRFTRYEPQTPNINTIQHFQEYIESAAEMETNYIVDATKENLPVHTFN